MNSNISIDELDDIDDTFLEQLINDDEILGEDSANRLKKRQRKFITLSSRKKWFYSTLFSLLSSGKLSPLACLIFSIHY